VLLRRTLLLLLLLVSFVVPAVSLAGNPADPDPNRFAKEIEAFRDLDSKNSVPAEPVLFVGSSSIRIWRTHDSFPALAVINRGFGGSHISDVIYFADRVLLPYKPSVVVFYAGDNDIAAGKSAQRVADDYRRFADLVHQRLPAAKIIFLAIKPSTQRWSFWPEMKRANELIRAFSQRDKRRFFADVATPLLRSDGTPDDSLFLDDKLHLNPEGYEVWTRALSPLLRKVLESRDGTSS
jgi:lysophospholipase L1-like esterase